MSAGPEEKDVNHSHSRASTTTTTATAATTATTAADIDKADTNGATKDPADARSDGGDGGDGGESEDDEEEEPKLKYSKLTGSLASVYRNGDATSAFMLAGDKLIIGTHNGIIHVISLPTFQTLRLYRAHTASVTAISVSPIPPPLQAARPDSTGRLVVSAPPPPPSRRASSHTSVAAPTSRAPKQLPPVPNISSNQIYIASASIDGHVCAASLVDQKDITLRNFARPVQAVALSPDYKADRTYLSAGLAGNVILTVGGKAGVSADANTNSAAAAASGWLGSIGLGSHSGKDTVLHSGEGTISTMKFSTTGKFVAWVNEQGIKIMRSHIALDSADTDLAWKRFAHVDRPSRKGWEDMASVWKARLEWVDENALETDEESPRAPNGTEDKTKGSKKRRVIEKLVVGWGDTAWVINVRPGGTSTGRHTGARTVATADIVHKLTFDDCVVSGLSLYTPSLLAILAYRTRDDDDKPIPSSAGEAPRPRRGRHNRQTGLQPELRLINVATSEEVDVDTLTVSRYESLSAADYQLGSLYVPLAPEKAPHQRGTLESFSTGFWDASANATRLLSSNASILSASSSVENGKSSVMSPVSGSFKNNSRPPLSSRKPNDCNPFLANAGLKLFIHSPYDCVLAIKRDLSDHLAWLLDHKLYSRAWELVDEYPSAVGPYNDQGLGSLPSSPSTSAKPQETSLADFFADTDGSPTSYAGRMQDSAVAKEKRRIGDLWLQQLVAKDDWPAAGQVAGKVLCTSSRWEYWVLAFAQAGHLDAITSYIPSTDATPALPSVVYEIVLGHYIGHDRLRFRDLLDHWDTNLFDASTVRIAIEKKLESGDVSETTTEDGVQGRDWRILLDGLAKLLLAEGHPRDALRCYIRIQNADAAMNLIREYHLADSLSDDIPGLLMLRVSKEQIKGAPLEELEEASAEVVRLLRDEAYQGAVRTETVVSQLQSQDVYRPFLFFYFRSLWQGRGTTTIETRQQPMSRADRRRFAQQAEEGKLLVEMYGDVAVSLFADYDREMLMEFLRSSVSYTYEKASHICEDRHFIPELVYLLSKTGQTKRALFLIIGELGDVSQAISFTKDNPDLWDDLLDYSMDKPRFIRALLEEVGTSIDPITLVRRIPNGLEIEGLRHGIGKMIREYDIQHSISDGVAKVLRGEVATGMYALRAGQKKAVKFAVAHETLDAIGEVEIRTEVVGEEPSSSPRKHAHERDAELKPGHCAGCQDPFHEDEMETLVGFTCAHVFHLSCLLDAKKADKATAAETLRGPKAADAADAGLLARSVRTKVEHARELRAVVGEGCALCVVPEGVGNAVE